MKKNMPFTEEWELYEKGKEYNYSIGLYEKVNTNERFYRGDQWDNLKSSGLPTPVFNIFKRIIGYFTSSDAREIILEAQRKEFIENELPAVLRRMHLLGLDPKELIK